MSLHHITQNRSDYTRSDCSYTAVCCMYLYSLSARFTQDGCDQRLQRRPLSPLRAPTKHAKGGYHWTDVCWPAQLLVAGACHSAHPRFISTSVTLWKNNTRPGSAHAMSLQCHRFESVPRVTSSLFPASSSTIWQRKKVLYKRGDIDNSSPFGYYWLSQITLWVFHILCQVRPEIWH